MLSPRSGIPLREPRGVIRVASLPLGWLVDCGCLLLRPLCGRGSGLRPGAGPFKVHRPRGLASSNGRHVAPPVEPNAVQRRSLVSAHRVACDELGRSVDNGRRGPAVYRWSIGEFLGYREIALTIDSHGFMSAVGFRNDTTMVMAANYTGPAPGPLDNRAVLWRFVGTGPRADSLLAMPGTRMTVFRQDGYATRYLSPFTPHAYAVFGLPGRVLVGYGGHDEIAVYDYNMTNVAAVDLDLPLLSVTRQDKSTSNGGATQPIHSVMKGWYICPTTE